MNLPSSIGNRTINELVNDPGCELIKRGNKISFRLRTENGLVTFEYTEYSTNHHEWKSSSAARQDRKKDYEQDILAMKSQGMLQKDIAFELGISPGYVSQILNRR